ncbi:MAG: hypothetical protein OEM38_04260 [Gammaproteobacteria bacterium]|nr:hypothetical protein [Gammaproteobacteria bacterium]
MKTCSWHLLIAIALFSTPLLAEKPTEKANLLTVSSLFSQMDSDKDGVIRPFEINKQSLLSNEFNEVDRNRDGVLDSTEFEVFIAKADI